MPGKEAQGRTVARKQTVIDDYLKEYPFLKKKDTYHVFCTKCRSAFSVMHGHGGSHDIKIHVNTDKHKTAVAELDGNAKLDKFGFFSNQANKIILSHLVLP